jgi:hypothetical protein
MPAEAEAAFLLACCGSPRGPGDGRGAPVRGRRRGARALAERTWWALPEADWLEAFAAHPRSARKAGRHRASRPPGPRGEQRRHRRGRRRHPRARSPPPTLAYAAKHGFIYIVCATGKTADEMLDLRERASIATRASELRTAAEEQAKITRLRLRKLAEG